MTRGPRFTSTTSPPGARLPSGLRISSTAHIRPSPRRPLLLPSSPTPKTTQALASSTTPKPLADSDPAAPRRRSRHAVHPGPLLRRQHPRPRGEGVGLRRRRCLREHQALHPQGNPRLWIGCGFVQSGSGGAIGGLIPRSPLALGFVKRLGFFRMLGLDGMLPWYFSACVDVLSRTVSSCVGSCHWIVIELKDVL
ncbi:hypothetical protein BAE44_0008576 [Dichanthelium oligosanthes]|uniref:Uncharacterized protein n=1 Tax=Dichanthelium oligosanthes TaxID=888268 RepID=A0A1E5VZ96_9POAL|nr:hypothetical protein BAE44_0008576 [Dichanthelium oligosanthes]